MIRDFQNLFKEEIASIATQGQLARLRMMGKEGGKREMIVGQRTHIYLSSTYVTLEQLERSQSVVSEQK